MKVAEFIERFLEGPVRGSHYLDLGRCDCGISDQALYLRDKAIGRVTEFPISELRISRRPSTRRNYYVLVACLFLLATCFAAFFMAKAIELDRNRAETYLVFAAFLTIMATPFLARAVTHGYRIIILYFILCAILSVGIGRWERYVPVEGFAALLALGILPYVGSRLFAESWKETQLHLMGDNEAVTLMCSQIKAERLATAIQGQVRAQDS